MDPLSQEMTPLVLELERIERQIEILEYEKRELRQRLTECLQLNQRQQISLPSVTGNLHLRLHTRTTIRYDETRLRERLGTRFKYVLAPDPSRLKLHQAEALQLLDPLLIHIGKVSRERVQAGFEQGLLDPADFMGAYERIEQHVLVVRKLSKPLSAPPNAPY